MGDPVAWLIELTVRPGQLEPLRVLTGDMIESARREPGVVIYERFIGPDHTVVHLYERYVDSAAAITHLHTFRATYADRFLALVDRTRVSVYGNPTTQLRTELDPLGATYLSPFGGHVRQPPADESVPHRSASPGAATSEP